MERPVAKNLFIIKYGIKFRTVEVSDKGTIINIIKNSPDTTAGIIGEKINSFMAIPVGKRQWEK